ncbi:hypothetical protein EST38_g13569 [Candolleomyces aberdarensis]|uniref:Uncharacterized protein n=1 Tax=Candolleomyces aberdarensis TaxID=2316362 RepID=A0A4Q2D2B8_9AGAR|nr:hypothetical protein EST38_g13569 [Candolleomyces aberdarensis]
MLLLVLLLYSCFCSETSGAPLASYQLSPLKPRDPDTAASVDTNYRSTPEIIWTCLATTFICTWVSVHPNVSQGPRWWDNMRDRLILFGWTLLAPELVLVFAYRQWEGVRLLRKLHGEEWGRVQCHFIQMGGVVISHEGQVRPIELSKVEENKLDKVIDRSRVVEAEILDRSKGDELSKGLVVIQTTWFIISCCARAIQRLTITNLEVITLAYAALNGMMYFFWWDKPLNVRLPVEVEVKVKDTFDRVSREEKSEKGPEGERAQTILDIISLPWTLARATMRYFARTTSKLSGSNIKNVNPLYYTFQGLDQTIGGEHRLKGMLTSFAITSCMASVFGALHLIAWSFPFPTPVAAELWRASSIYSAASPWLILFIAFLSFWAIADTSSYAYKTLASINKILILLYIPARVILDS